MTKSLGALRPCAELGGSLGQGGQWPAGVLQGCPGLPVGMTDQGAQEGGPWARLVGFTRKGKSQAQGQGKENPNKQAGDTPAKFPPEVPKDSQQGHQQRASPSYGTVQFFFS